MQRDLARTYEELEEAVRAAKRAEGEAQVHQHDAARDLEAAELELHESIAAAAAGEIVVGDDRLDELYGRVRDRQAVTTLRIRVYPDGVPDAKIIDVAGAARLEGCKRAVWAAEQALNEFATEHVAELEAERQPITAQVGLRAVAASSAAVRSSREIEAEAGWHATLLRRAGLEHLIGSIKPNPFPAELQVAPAGTETGPIPTEMFF